MYVLRGWWDLSAWVKVYGLCVGVREHGLCVEVMPHMGERIYWAVIVDTWGYCREGLPA